MSRVAVVLFVVLTGVDSEAASKTHSELVASVRVGLSRLELNRARREIRLALDLSETPGERALALGLLGRIEFIDQKAWTTAKLFMSAARAGGRDVFETVFEDVSPGQAEQVRTLATCAGRLAHTNATNDVAAEMFFGLGWREELDSTLEERMVKIVGSDAFRCPVPEPDPVPVLTEAPPPSGPPPATWVLGGTGLAAAGVGIGFFVSGLDRVESSTGRSFSDDLNAAEDQLLVSGIAFGVAGAALVASIVFWVTHEPEEFSVGPGSVGLRF